MLAWHREGGVARFCEDVVVSTSDEAVVTSCAAGEPAVWGQAKLDARQLAAMESWVNTLQPFEHVRTDPATADGMIDRIVFAGAGQQQAQEPDLALVFDFAQSLFNEVAIAAGEPPEACLTPGTGQQLLVDEAHAYCLLYPAPCGLLCGGSGNAELVMDTMMNHMDPRVSIMVEDAAGPTSLSNTRSKDSSHEPRL